VTRYIGLLATGKNRRAVDDALLKKEGHLVRASIYMQRQAWPCSFIMDVYRGLDIWNEMKWINDRLAGVRCLEFCPSSWRDGISDPGAMFIVNI
jgi:hypothetical protein